MCFCFILLLRFVLKDRQHNIQAIWQMNEPNEWHTITTYLVLFGIDFVFINVLGSLDVMACSVCEISDWKNSLVLVFLITRAELHFFFRKNRNLSLNFDLFGLFFNFICIICIFIYKYKQKIFVKDSCIVFLHHSYVKHQW